MIQSRRSLPSIAMPARAPKSTIWRQRSEQQRTLQLLFVAFVYYGSISHICFLCRFFRFLPPGWRTASWRRNLLPSMQRFSPS